MLRSARACSDREAVDMAYHVLRNDGIFVGPSAALNLVGAVKLARKLGPGHTVVTVICDSGERYRSKLFNDEFLTARGLLPSESVLQGSSATLDFVK
jgi:cysteine synthase